MGLGRTAWRQARQTLQELLGQAHSRLAQDAELQSRCIIQQACACISQLQAALCHDSEQHSCVLQADIEMALPALVGDYTGGAFAAHALWQECQV